MFPSDPRSIGQMFEANLLAAPQHRTRGPVVTQRTRWWTALFEREETAWTAAHELFTGLGRTQLNRVAKKFTVLDVESGRSLGSQGSAASEFAVILQGRVGVTINGVPHAVLDDGSHFGSVALLDEQSSERRASFDVMAPSRIAIADDTRFSELLDEFPIVAKRIRAMADIRRAYLAGVAAADNCECLNLIDAPGYPAHIEDPVVRL